MIDPAASAIDLPQVIEQEAARIVAALVADPAGRVPWAERWTVATVARHVGGTHHVVARVIEDRPTADFGLFGSLDIPDKADPAFPAWCAAGAAALVDQLRATDPSATCWSWDADDQTVGFWARRMAHETLVHRWDAQAGLGGTPEPMDPVLAADSLDEYADVMVRFSRGLQNTAPGPPVAIVCTDVEAAWYLAFPEAGGRVVQREPAAVALTLRGPAEGLLLALWGRLDVGTAGVSVEGDASIFERWADLVPPL